MNLLVRLLINTLAIIIAAYLLPGVAVGGFFVALVVAIVLGIINVSIKPILQILTLPLTIITLGLFALILNALLIQLASVIVPDFTVDNFGWAILFSLVLSLINWFLVQSTRGPRHQPPQRDETTYLN